MSGEPLIRIENLKKYFEEEGSFLERIDPRREPPFVRAVDGVDLTIDSGETLGLVGESGCGKSTLARAMTRLIEPTSGRVFYKGEDILQYSKQEMRALRSEIKMIFQDPFASLNPRYTVRKTLVEPMRVHGIGDSKADRVERAGELLSEVGLDEAYLSRYPHEFSGGQRQRIALARALSVDPEVIIADEPTSALDVSVQAKILKLIAERREEWGLTLLFITHDLSVMRYISDRVGVMYLGKIVEINDTDDLFKDPNHPYTRSLLSSIPIPDPDRQQTSTRLEGEVSSPINPPDGCRFHPRCPEVIPPADWDGTQPAWRAVFSLASRITSGDLTAEQIRVRLEHMDGQSGSSDDSPSGRYLDRHLPGDVPDDSKATLQSALDALMDDDRTAASAALQDEFTSPCQTDVPELTHRECGNEVACHLYEPTDRPESR